ncbi:MAG: hypothetical protein ACOVOD_01780, partial [Rhodoferax sp.]
MSERTSTAAADMPPVTQGHLRRAHEQMKLPGLTYEQAMAIDTRRRCIEAYAHALRTREWETTHMRCVVPVCRVRLGSDGHPIGWCTQLVLGPHEPLTQPELDIN